MYVIPHPGYLVVDPVQLATPQVYLPPEGREIEPSDYWTRRLRDGDVTLGQPPAEHVATP